MRKVITTAFLVLSLISVQRMTAQDMWKLIWRDHYRPNQLFEVVRTDISRADVDNRVFNSWCIPFDPNAFNILFQQEIAGDEHWKTSAQVLTDHGLPMLNERWFQIMDDERWYVYHVTPR